MKKQKYALNLLLILALTGFALWFALKDNFQQVLKCISQMNLISLVVILLWGRCIGDIRCNVEKRSMTLLHAKINVKPIIFYF